MSLNWISKNVSNDFCEGVRARLVDKDFAPKVPDIIDNAYVIVIWSLSVPVDRCKRSQKLQPPGPWKLPLIGNLHKMVSPLLHHVLRDLANKYGPIMHLQLGEISAVVISSPQVAKEVLKQHEISYAQRPQTLAVDIMSYNGSSMVFCPYSDYWRQVRKICVTELLSVKRVHSFQPMRQQEVEYLIQLISSSSSQGLIPINFSEKIFSWSNTIISMAAFGMTCKDASLFTQMLRDLNKLAGGFALHDIFPSLKIVHFISGTKPALERMHRQMDKILDSIVSDHKAKRKNNDVSAMEDLVDVLLKFEETSDLNFSLTTDNIKAIILDIFGAGSETSATTIEWAMSELLKNPRVMEKAQAEVREAFTGKSNIDEADVQELNYLKLIVKETLRLHPPTPLLPRESREICEIHGYEIPAKTKVLINMWAINRDPKHWVDADCFQPERFLDSPISFKGTNFEYIPFGAGRRMCPGISFAMASIELALARLLYHFDWRLPNGIKSEELNMTEIFGISSKRKYDLELIAIPMSSAV
ncbi:premnaspirodiene oxygenase-like [Cornus florida]|uniref:premnaspirodiene oxygenase-like n=1 Tax=Cornus florida TaxID=4283 RepID=UPI00289C5CE0|nr:premnaspirodiene oxygenase-like [Cornus florida]